MSAITACSSAANASENVCVEVYPARAGCGVCAHSRSDTFPFDGFTRSWLRFRANELQRAPEIAERSYCSAADRSIDYGKRFACEFIGSGGTNTDLHGNSEQ